MKLLYGLGSCFHSRGATVTPSSAEAEPCLSGLRSSSRLRDDQRASTNRGSGSGTAVTTVTGSRNIKTRKGFKNWKPKLHVISENAVGMNHNSPSAVRSDNNKLSVDVKAKSKPKVSIQFLSRDDYWNSSRMWAVPAFSPGPFGF